MSSYMAGVFDLDLDVDNVQVVDSDEDDIIDVDEACIIGFFTRLHFMHLHNLIVTHSSNVLFSQTLIKDNYF